MTPEHEFLGYLVCVATEDVNSSYALGRMREAVAGRVKRLPMASDESAFMRRLLGLCQAAGGGRASSPEQINLMGGRIDASPGHLGSVLGLIRHRLLTSAVRAA